MRAAPTLPLRLVPQRGAQRRSPLRAHLRRPRNRQAVHPRVDPPIKTRRRLQVLRPLKSLRLKTPKGNRQPRQLQVKCHRRKNRQVRRRRAKNPKMSIAPRCVEESPRHRKIASLSRKLRLSPIPYNSCRRFPMAEAPIRGPTSFTGKRAKKKSAAIKCWRLRGMKFGLTRRH